MNKHNNNNKYNKPDYKMNYVYTSPNKNYITNN